MGAQLPIAPTAPGGAHGARPRVLVLDADLIALVESYLLLRDRHDVALWPGGHGVPALLERVRPDPLVVDLDLGGRLLGWGLVCALRDRRGRGVPAVLHSGDRRALAQLPMPDADTRAWLPLPRPFTTGQLTDAIATVLSRSPGM